MKAHKLVSRRWWGSGWLDESLCTWGYALQDMRRQWKEVTCKKCLAMKDDPKRRAKRMTALKKDVPPPR